MNHPPGVFTLPTAPGWHQLLYAGAGVMSVHTRSGTWAAPRDRAVWVPAGDVPRVVAHGRVSVRALYLTESLWPIESPCRVVVASPLLRELILHLARICPLDVSAPRHRRLADVLIDHLLELPDAPLRLTMPTDPRALAAAHTLLAAPGTPASVDSLAAQGGASRRTLERLFATETGLSLSHWRRRLRIIEAIRLLADGTPVTQVATTVGYSTPSAFAAMFRAETGTPPSTYRPGLVTAVPPDVSNPV